jgi:hypothetical protein
VGGRGGEGDGGRGLGGRWGPGRLQRGSCGAAAWQSQYPLPEGCRCSCSRAACVMGWKSRNSAPGRVGGAGGPSVRLQAPAPLRTHHPTGVLPPPLAPNLHPDPMCPSCNACCASGHGSSGAACTQHGAPVAAAVLSTPLVAAPAAPASDRISDALPRTTVGLSCSRSAQICGGCRGAQGGGC